jgi:spermidine synthase
MSMLVDRRTDGSVAFFLDGDLQFDSQDEHIYHEGLALPALALAEARGDQQLKILIIGGGDGLTARQLLKSLRVDSIDLVDCDASVIELARTEFAQLNGDSLADQRVRVSVEDARQFIGRAIEGGIKYDVIISDLTASHDVDGAQLHTVEFYNTLRQLLGDDGVLAVNSASPSGTPEAYWSIFNSMLAGSLNPRPYRIFLPSFVEQGYGVDWGFILASPKQINSDDIGNQLKLVEPRRELKDGRQIRNLFSLPEEVFARQASASAGSGDSDVLVHYLFNADPVRSESGVLIDTLSIDLAQLTAPQQSGLHLLPEELHQKLSSWQDDPAKQEAFIAEVVELMPALNRFQTREMIMKFLAMPASFLAPIDLGALVNVLLNRASELPGKLVQELVFLRDRIVEFSEDHERLFALGSRCLAIIAVVVIMGNLMYPDAVYAKGGADHGGHAGHAEQAGHAGHAGHVGVVNRGTVGTVGTVNTVVTGGHWGPWFTNANGKRVRNWVR